MKARIYFCNIDVVASAATFSEADISGETSLCSRQHIHDLLCNEESSQVITGDPNFQNQSESLPYQYSFIASSDVPKNGTSSLVLGDFYTSGFYA